MFQHHHKVMLDRSLYGNICREFNEPRSPKKQSCDRIQYDILTYYKVELLEAGGT